MVAVVGMTVEVLTKTVSLLCLLVGAKAPTAHFDLKNVNYQHDDGIIEPPDNQVCVTT